MHERVKIPDTKLTFRAAIHYYMLLPDHTKEFTRLDMRISKLANHNIRIERNWEIYDYTNYMFNGTLMLNLTSFRKYQQLIFPKCF